MSYIHEALKKAQTERDRAKGPDMGHPVPGRKPSFFTGRKIILSAALLTLLLLAFAGYSWWDLGNKKQTTPPLQMAIDSERSISKKIRPAAPMKPQMSPAPKASDGEKVSAEAVARKPLDRKDIEESYQKARALHRDGRLLDAALWYEKVIALDPGHIWALNNRGVLYLRDKNYSLAQKYFMRAIRLKPGYVDPYYNMACVSAAVGQLDQGLWYLKKAVSINPEAKKWAQEDPDLNPLRGAPGYNEITAK